MILPSRPLAGSTSANAIGIWVLEDITPRRLYESKSPKRQESSGLMSFVPIGNGELYKYLTQSDKCPLSRGWGGGFEVAIANLLVFDARGRTLSTAKRCNNASKIQCVYPSNRPLLFDYGSMTYNPKRSTGTNQSTFSFDEKIFAAKENVSAGYYPKAILLP